MGVSERENPQPMDNRFLVSVILSQFPNAHTKPYMVIVDRTLIENTVPLTS